MLPIATVIALLLTSPSAASFLPADASPEIVTDPGIQMLARLVSSATEFKEGDRESLIRKLLATRALTLPAAQVWLRVYADRPEEKRLPWREHAAVMILALGRSREKGISEFLKEALEWNASDDYATFPDFAGMETGAKLRDYIAYAYLNIDLITARDLALEFIKKDPFASRVCAVILDQCWGPKASRAVLDLARNSSWTTTIATALQVLKRHDPGMYITALQVLRRELEEPAPLLKTPSDRFRHYVRRNRLVQAFGICREKAVVKTLMKLLDPKDRGTRAKRVSASPQRNMKGADHRSVTEESIVAIQDILGRDFGYTDDQSDEDRRAVIDRCKRFVRTRM